MRNYGGSRGGFTDREEYYRNSGYFESDWKNPELIINPHCFIGNSEV